MTSEVKTYGERSFTARKNNTLVRDRQQMLANIDAKRDQVIDAPRRRPLPGAGAGATGPACAAVTFQAPATCRFRTC